MYLHRLRTLPQPDFQPAYGFETKRSHCDKIIATFPAHQRQSSRPTKDFRHRAGAEFARRFVRQKNIRDTYAVLRLVSDTSSYNSVPLKGRNKGDSLFA